MIPSGQNGCVPYRSSHALSSECVGLVTPIRRLSELPRPSVCSPLIVGRSSRRARPHHLTIPPCNRWPTPPAPHKGTCRSNYSACRDIYVLLSNFFSCCHCSLRQMLSKTVARRTTQCNRLANYPFFHELVNSPSSATQQTPYSTTVICPRHSCQALGSVLASLFAQWFRSQKIMASRGCVASTFRMFLTLSFISQCIVQLQVL